MVGLFNGDALRIPLKDKSVHCVVTSPPYWKKRDYGTAGQLGLERTPEEYVDNMVKVFREVHRVLRNDGTLWLVLGDTYAGSNCGSNDHRPKGASLSKNDSKYRGQKAGIPKGLKRKDLVGIPWRVAFALQADGWYLRRDIIWHKTNGMPESATDRPSTSHEYVFLFSKREFYYFDMEAVREEYTKPLDRWGGESLKAKGKSDWDADTGQNSYRDRSMRPNAAGRNLRSVWSIQTSGYSGKHFATYPPALVEPCIKAGTSEEGCCPICGMQNQRILEKIGSFPRRWSDANAEGSPYEKQDSYQNVYMTTGWITGCTHPVYPVPSIVFDPFVGSGTTLLVARKLGRYGIGMDLSFDYLNNQAKERLGLTALKEWQDGPSQVTNDLDDLPLFG